LTQEDLKLDLDIFYSKFPLVLFRLARAKYANLSGIGAAFTPGRWNAAGQEAIYTSIDPGVPILERLVHTPKELIPTNLALMKIRMHGKWRYSVSDSGIAVMGDTETGGCVVIFQSLKAALAIYSAGSKFPWSIAFAVALPSVVVPSWNFVLYPAANAFWEHISLVSVDPYEFDPRLFPEGAQRESVSTDA
jgi:RES domain-containing protein